MTDRDLLHGWTLAMARQVGVGLTGVIWLALVARNLDPTDVGHLVVLGSLPPLLVPLLTFGIPMALSYLVARGTYPVSTLKAWAATAVRTLVQFAIGLGALALAIGYAVGLDATLDIVAVVVTLPAGAAAMIAAAYFQGQRHFGKQAVLMASPFVVMALGAIALSIAGTGELAPFVLVFTAAYSFAGLLAFASLCLGPIATKPVGVLAAAWPFAWRSYVSEALASVRTRADILIVALVLGSSAAGYFGTASIVAAQLSMLSLAANQVVFPLSASRGDPDETDAQDDATPRAARLTLWLTGLTTALAAAGSGPLLRLLFGEDFLSAQPVLLAALPSVVFLSLSRVVTADLYGRAETAKILRISVQATIISLVLMPLGAIFGGTTGAALALSASAGCNTWLRVRTYHKLSGTPSTDLIVIRREDVMALRGLLRSGDAVPATVDS